MSVDGCRGIICDREDGLHVHHNIDRDKTNDDDSNLVTLCNFCHAGARIELGRVGGAARVKNVIDHCTGYKGTREIEGTDCE